MVFGQSVRHRCKINYMQAYNSRIQFYNKNFLRHIIDFFVFETSAIIANCHITDFLSFSFFFLYICLSVCIFPYTSYTSLKWIVCPCYINIYFLWGRNLDAHTVFHAMAFFEQNLLSRYVYRRWKGKLGRLVFAQRKLEF